MRRGLQVQVIAYYLHLGQSVQSPLRREERSVCQPLQEWP